MIVPATPVQPAPVLAPVGVVSSAPASFGTPSNSTLKVRSEQLNVLQDHRAWVTGTMLVGGQPAAPGEAVTLQTPGAHGWRTLALAHTASRGRFRLTYVPSRLGSRLLRLHFAGDAFARAARRRLGTLNVFHLAGASWYGGGGSMACGGELTSSTLGVANKTLPCGTLVTLRYDGHTVRVPVVDRGPYVEGREYDLTEATKQALGFGDTGQIWSTG